MCLQHAVVAIMSDNVTTLPLLLPSFLCLCTALVFGPVSQFELKTAYSVRAHRLHVRSAVHRDTT